MSSVAKRLLFGGLICGFAAFMQARVFASTSLTPAAIAVSSSSIQYTWSPIAGSSYAVAFSTDPSFATTGSSGTLTVNTTSYPGLRSSTSYFFELKIATESDTSYLSNSVATMTSAGISLLSPNIVGVSSASIAVNWASVSSSYIVALSSVSSFAVLKSSGLLGTNATSFFNLAPATTYYVKVKVSTESDGSYSFNLISTRTAQNFMTPLFPGFNSISSFSATANWANISSANYVAALSSDPFFSVTFSSALITNATTNYVGLAPNTSYYLRVKLSTETDSSYMINTATFSTLALSPLTSLAPLFTFVTANSAHATWTSIAGATYTVALSTDSAFSVTTASTPMVSSNFTFNSLASSTTYFLRVKISSESDASYGPNSISTTTTLPPTTVLSPNFVSVSSVALTINWTSVASASYTISLATTPSFTVVLASGSLTTNASSFVNLNPSMLYFFQIKLSTETDASYIVNRISTQTLAPPAVTLLFPQITAVSNNSISASWSSIASAAYTLALSTDPGFSVTSASGSFTSNTTNFFSLNPNTTYYLSVKVSTESDSSYLLNSISTKTAALPPTVLSPNFVSISSTALNISWTSVASASYTISLATVPSFTVVLASGGVTSNASSYLNLNPSKLYYFQVKLSTESDVSYGVNKISTQTLAPTAATLLSPQITAFSSTSISASWTSIASAVYAVVLSTDPGFSVTNASGAITANTTNFLSLNPSTVYFLSVKISTESDASYLANTISTKTAALPSTTTVLHPTIASLSSNSFGLSWNSAGTSYVVALATSVSFGSTISSGTLTSNTTFFSGLVPSTLYFAHVKVSTESDSSYSVNSVSTQTLSASTGTALHAQVLFSGPDTLAYSWDAIGVNYEIVLATTSSFSPAMFDEVIGSPNRNYVGLMADSTYFFRVRVSTDAAFNAPISTKTTPVIGGGNWALQFNGNQVMTVPSNTQLSLQVNNTVEFWFRRTSTTSASLEELITKDSPSKDSGWGIFLQPAGQVRYEPFFSGGSAGIQSINGVTDFAWHHVALVRDNTGNATLYLDGALQDSRPTTIPAANSYPLKMGRAESGAEKFNGELDEVRFWNQTRTQTEIQQARFTHLTGNESTLSAYWDFDAGAGQTVPNRSILYGSALDGVRGLSSAIESVDPLWVNDPIPAFGAPTDVVAPLALVLSPSNGSTQTVQTLATISGTAVDNQFVQSVKAQIRRNSDGLTLGFSGGSYFWDSNNNQLLMNGTTNWSQNLAGAFWSTGGYHLTVQAQDNNFNIGFTSADFTVVTSSEAVPPTVAITYPIAGSTYTANQLTLFSGVSADNVAVANVKVQLTRLVDGKRWDGPTVSWLAPPQFNDTALSPSGNWQYTLPISAWTTDSIYQLTAQAVDASGNISTTTMLFTMQVGTSSANDIVPPTIQIVYPATGTTHTPTDLASLYGTAADNQALGEIAINVQDLSTSLFWNGSVWSSVSPIWFNTGVAFNWNFSGIPPGAWINSHQYRIMARAKDTANNIMATSADFFVVSGSTLDTIPPAIAVNSPVSGNVYSPTSLTFNGSAGDNVGLVMVDIALKRQDTGLYYDGTSFTSGAPIYLPTNGLSAWTFSIPPAAFGNASYGADVRAKDTSGNMSDVTVNFSITGAAISGDVTPPVITISTPMNNVTYTNPALLNNLLGSTTDNVLVSEVAFSMKDDANHYWDGAGWNQPAEFWLIAVPPVNGQWNAYMPFLAWKNGSFVMRARARDSANNVTYTSATFIVNGSSSTGSADTVPPQTYIYNPANGASQSPYAFTSLNGRSEDAFGVNEVVVSLKNLTTGLYWNGAGFNQTSEFWTGPAISLTDAQHTDWNFTMAIAAYSNGPYVFRVRAKDASGNIGYVSSTFTVMGAGAGAGDLTAPTISISSPLDGQTVTSSSMALIVGVSSDNVAVTNVDLRIMRQSTGDRWNGFAWSPTDFWMPANGLTNWTLGTPVSMWADGSYVISARARDAALNETIDTHIVTVSGSGSAGVAPTVSVVFPQTGLTYAATSLLLLSGTAADDVSVASVQLRITDVNLNVDWNPDTKLWTPGTYWFPATTAGGVQWTSGRLPAWTPGKYRVLAQAIDNSGLYSTPQPADFNIAGAQVGGTDFTAPSQISDLKANTGLVQGSIILTWTAPGNDDTVGTADHYIVKYNPGSPITETNWFNAYDVTLPPVAAFPPAPLPSGTTQAMTISNLAPGVGYFFAMRALDAASNRSAVSNSPIASAFSGCTAGSGDGEGTVTLSTPSIAESVQTNLSLVFRVGTSGISTGGSIVFKIPDGWIIPQSQFSGMPGYFSVQTSNGIVGLTNQVNGSLITVNVANGTLAANDTVTLSYLASPLCGGPNPVKFSVMSQATSCGRLTGIAVQPVVGIVPGPATRIGFDNFERVAPVGQVISFNLQGQNNCGGVAGTTVTVPINLSAAVWDTTTFRWVVDPQADISLASDMSASFSSAPIAMNSGQTTKTIYYRVNGGLSVDHKVRITYQDLQLPFTNDNIMRVIPSATTQAISATSVDTGASATGGTTATITPNGDGIADVAFINFQTGNPTLTWNVKISKDNFVTTAAEFWGVGNPARQAWDARRSYPYNDIAPVGTYAVKITAGGATDTSLSIVVQASQVTGTVKSSSGLTVVSGANINFFGTTSRYAQTDSSGTFSFTGLPAGSYTLQIDKPGFASYRSVVTINGSSQDLGAIVISPLAKLVFNGTRSDTSLETWGTVRAAGTAFDVRGSVHFALGKAAADDGFGVNSPEMYLKPGDYALSVDIPGFSVAPVNKTFADGEVYQWNISLASKSGLTGRVRLANGLANTSGIAINLSAGLDANGDGKFDLGYPTAFASAFMPAPENEATFAFPGMDPGLYRVVAMAPGYAQTAATVQITTASISQDFVLAQTGQATVTLQVVGNSLPLDTINGDAADGLFPVNVRLQSTTGFVATKTTKISTNATLASGSLSFTGIPDGTYAVTVDPLLGFDLSPTGAKTLVVAAGVGTVPLVLAQNSGSITGTVGLPIGSAMGSLQFGLSKSGVQYPAPTLNGNGFTFANLDSGFYSLSIFDPLTSASQVQSVWVTNGAATTANFNLVATNVFSVRGTVLTIAGAPYQSLNSIVANSSSTLIYLATGSMIIPALRVEAYLLGADNSAAVLPTTTGSALDPAKIRFGFVDSVTGNYVIDGLRAGARYKLRLNPDLNNDGVFDIPLDEKTLTLQSNSVGVDFTVRDGARIDGTVSSLISDNGHALTVTLTDTDLKAVVRSQSLSLVGSDAAFSFPNIRPGHYLIRVIDNDSPAKYAAKPSFVTLDSASDVKTVAVTLTRGSTIRGKLADKTGQLITSSNVTDLLPTGSTVRFISSGHQVDATGPDSDGVYSASVLPDVDYTISIDPPQQISQRSGAKRFLPVSKRARVSEGQFFDWGVIVLDSGVDLTGAVKDDSQNPLGNIPVFAYQSLSKSVLPLKTVTDAQGNFVFESLDPRIRFYDVVANPAGNTESQPTWSQASKTMIDTTKLLPNQTIGLQLTPLASGIKGVAISTAGLSLVASYGVNQGLPGVAILVTKRGSQQVLEYLSESTGTFNIRLSPGRYDVEFMAQGHKPYTVSNVLVSQTVDLGTIGLISGFTLAGTIRNADGSLPGTEQVAKLLAIDPSNNIFRANLINETITDTVDRYSFYGLQSGSFTLAAVDQLGRLRVLKDAFPMPAQDTTLNLTFSVTEPQLVASFIQKLPDGVEAIFGCNQAFRNNLDDLDGNGTADDQEFEKFVQVVRGNGTLAFTSVSADRHKASYEYTQGNETGVSSLQLAASFHTDQIDPKTGANYIATGTFVHPFGLQSQQTDVVTNLGADFVLPGGSSLSMPTNWSHATNLDGTVVGFQAADSLATVTTSNKEIGIGAKALARQLGSAAYPPQMYRAIKALDSTPSVDPFSSFFDIFLPANVSRLFNNKPTLTLTYDGSADPDKINVYYFNEAQGVYTLENVDRRVDTQNHTISVSIGHASVFTVLASSAPIIRGDGYTGNLDVFNFPNPFDLQTKTVNLQNPGSNSAARTIQGTMIKVSASDGDLGGLEIQIFNVAGEKVRTLNGDISQAGYYYIEWDGKNDAGQNVASGVYIGRMTIGGKNEKHFKMAVIK